MIKTGQWNEKYKIKEVDIYEQYRKLPREVGKTYMDTNEVEDEIKKWNEKTKDG